MIEPEHIEAAAPRRAARIDMILGIDEKARRAAGQISRRQRLVDRAAAANQHAATLGRLCGTGVRDDRFEHRVLDAKFWSAHPSVGVAQVFRPARELH